MSVRVFSLKVFDTQMINPQHIRGVAVPSAALPMAMGALSLVGIVYSRNVDMWLLCLGSLWIAILCVGGRKTHPVFWWFVIVSWCRVFANVVLADVDDLDLKIGEKRRSLSV